MPFCKPSNAGLQSTDRAVANRIGRLMTALDTEINSFVVQGTISDEIAAFRYQLMCKLEAEGWSMSYDGGNRLKVRPPGHRKPFARRTVA